MTAREHIALVRRLAESQEGRVVAVPRDSLRAVLHRAELGDELARCAFETADAEAR